MRIDLLRHGECDDDAWLRGRVNSALTERGWQQMQAQLAASPGDWESVIASPARRCWEFACEAFTSGLKMDSAWQERDFGEWDGLTFDQVRRRDPARLEAYLSNPFQSAIPGAESYAEFERRIADAWRAALNSSASSVLLVTHGGPIRLVLKQLFMLSDETLFQWRIDPGCRVSLEVTATDTGPFVQLLGLSQNGSGE